MSVGIPPDSEVGREIASMVVCQETGILLWLS